MDSLDHRMDFNGVESCAIISLDALVNEHGRPCPLVAWLDDFCVCFRWLWHPTSSEGAGAAVCVNDKPMWLSYCYLFTIITFAGIPDTILHVTMSE